MSEDVHGPTPNPYLDHLLALVKPDGSYEYTTKNEGGSRTLAGGPDVKLAAVLALVAEIRALRKSAS